VVDPGRPGVGLAASGPGLPPGAAGAAVGTGAGVWDVGALVDTGDAERPALASAPGPALGPAPARGLPMRPGATGVALRAAGGGDALARVWVGDTDGATPGDAGGSWGNPAL
jgi:hypothetical protein